LVTCIQDSGANACSLTGQRAHTQRTSTHQHCVYVMSTPPHHNTPHTATDSITWALSLAEIETSLCIPKAAVAEVMNNNYVIYLFCLSIRPTVGPSSNIETDTYIRDRDKYIKT